MIIIVINTIGISINIAFIKIFAESLLVLYSSSIFKISSLLRSLNKYLLMKGILINVIYNLWYKTSIEKPLVLVPCCNFFILAYSDFPICFAKAKYAIPAITNKPIEPNIIYFSTLASI